MVISILVMLMAILLPTVQRVRRQARAVVCQSNLRQWGILFNVQAAGSDGDLTFDPYEPSGSVDYWASFDEHFGPEMDHVFLCPMAARVDTGNPEGSTFSAWWHRTSPEGQIRAASYGFNVGVSHMGPPFGMLGFGPGITGPSAVKGAGCVPVIFDCTDGLTAGDHERGPPPYEGCIGPGTGWSVVCINRHDGGVNCLFLDFSVRKVGLKALWTLKWHKEFDTTGPWTTAGGVMPEDWPEWMRRFKDY